MATDENTTNGSTTVLEPNDAAADELLRQAEDIAAKQDKKSKKKRKKDDEAGDLEREIEFETPFGKIELEFEPTPTKQRKDLERREKAAREAAKAAERAQRKLAEQAEKVNGGGRGGHLLLILLVIGLIGAAIAIAWWLFARPADELEEVPDELRVAPALEPEPQGALDKITARLRNAVHAGRHASAETQREQMRRYEEITGNS